MDNMFKGVSTLISVEMDSLNYVEIISMISTFENCTNLNTVKIKGFNTNKIKSMQKLFYNSLLKRHII